MADDPRFTAGLMADVYAVLEQHGYRLPTDQARRHRALGGAGLALLQLVRAYEGGDR